MSVIKYANVTRIALTELSKKEERYLQLVVFHKLIEIGYEKFSPPSNRPQLINYIPLSRLSYVFIEPTMGVVGVLKH